MKTPTSFALFIYLACAMFFLHSCATSTITTSVDSTINFATYRTFAWLPDSSWKETKYDNAIVQRKVEQETVRLLKAKGYALDTLQADFLVHHHITVEDRTRTIQAPVYRYSPSIFFHRFGYYYSMREPMMVSNRFREIPYREGTLIVDVVDRKQQRLVWRGWSEQPMENIAELERSLSIRLGEILSQFPAATKPTFGVQ